MRINWQRFRVIVPVFCLLTFVFCTSDAYAALEKGPVQKLARGLTHIVTAPFQIPKEIIQTTAETEPVYLAPWRGMTVGAGTGVFSAGRQLISGFYDLFTFWSPTGRDWGPVFEPATLFPEI